MLFLLATHSVYASTLDEMIQAYNTGSAPSLSELSGFFGGSLRVVSDPNTSYMHGLVCDYQNISERLPDSNVCQSDLSWSEFGSSTNLRTIYLIDSLIEGYKLEAQADSLCASQNQTVRTCFKKKNGKIFQAISDVSANATSLFAVAELTPISNSGYYNFIHSDIFLKLIASAREMSGGATCTAPEATSAHWCRFEGTTFRYKVKCGNVRLTYELRYLDGSNDEFYSYDFKPTLFDVEMNLN